MQWKNSATSYGVISRSIHWISALAIAVLFGLGLWMVELTYYDSWYTKAPAIHKSIGVSLFALTLFRIVWNALNKKPEPISDEPEWENKLASWMHITLYLVLILVMVSGYLISTAKGDGVEVFGIFTIPATLQGIDNQEDVAGLIHYILAVSIITLAVFHAAAALKHHFINKDQTLNRMLGRDINQ